MGLATTLILWMYLHSEVPIASSGPYESIDECRAAGRAWLRRSKRLLKNVDLSRSQWPAHFDCVPYASASEAARARGESGS